MNQNNLNKNQEKDIVYIDGKEHLYIPQEDIYMSLEPHIGRGEVAESAPCLDVDTSYKGIKDKQALVNYLLSDGPRRRTIKECLAEVKQLDNNTAVTEFFIRQLCRQGKIDYYLSGNKSLVEANSLLRYLGYRVS